jgi:hypothetical protein
VLLGGMTTGQRGFGTRSRPKTPGILVAFHEGMALSITVAIVAVHSGAV